MLVLPLDVEDVTDHAICLLLLVVMEAAMDATYRRLEVVMAHVEDVISRKQVAAMVVAEDAI